MGAGQCGYVVGPLQEMLVVQRSRYHDLLSQALQPLVGGTAKTEPWPPLDVTTEAQAGEFPTSHCLCSCQTRPTRPGSLLADLMTSANSHEGQARAKA